MNWLLKLYTISIILVSISSYKPICFISRVVAPSLLVV